ncbi:MAG: hypothetical protein WBG90_03985 [Saonia sp.]
MGSLKVAFSELFSVSLKQPFYENGISEKYTVTPVLDYKIVPTKHCQTVLNRLEMIMKIDADKGGFTVWCRTNGSNGANELLYFKPRSGDLLTFVVTLSNPYFLNYNDLPPEPPTDRVYYFNNLVPDPVAPKDDLHLSFNIAGVSDTDTLKKIANGYDYLHLSNVAPGTAKLVHIASGYEMLPSSHINQGGQAHLSFDLTDFPNGKCELLIGGVSIETAYNMDEMGDTPVFAIVECSLDELVLPNYRIIENDGSITPQRPRYTLLFNNRPTLWRYQVLLEENSPLYKELSSLSAADKADFLNRINVISNDTGVVFVPTIISDKHFEFVSNTPKLLQEKYVSSSSIPGNPLTLALKKYVNHPTIPTEDIKVNLPYPPAHQLDATSDPVIYSDVYLNL